MTFKSKFLSTLAAFATLFSTIAPGVNLASASPLPEIVLKCVQDAKDLDLSKVPNCNIRVGQGCGEMDQEEILECISILAKGKPTSLNLSQTNLSIQDLSKTFQLCPNLTELDLSNNGLLAAETKELCNLIQSSKIKVLDLGYNSIATAGVVEVAEMLKANESIEELNLSGNICWDLSYSAPIHESGDPAAIALSDALKMNRNLMVLKIRSNQISSTHGVWAFCDAQIALKKNETARQVDLSGNDLAPTEGSEDSALNIVRSINPDLILIFED